MFRLDFTFQVDGYLLSITDAKVQVYDYRFMNKMDVRRRYYCNNFYYLFVVYLTKVTSIYLNNQFEKASQAVLFRKQFLQRMSTLVYQGRRKKGRGLLKLEVALIGKNSSRLLRRSLSRTLPSLSPPRNEFSFRLPSQFDVVFIVVFKQWNFF